MTPEQKKAKTSSGWAKYHKRNPGAAKKSQEKFFASLTPEEAKQRKDYRNAQAREKYQALSMEERRQIVQEKQKRAEARKAGIIMEKPPIPIEDPASYALKAKKTPEEKAQARRLIVQRHRAKLAQRSEDDKKASQAQYREWARRWRENRTPEKVEEDRLRNCATRMARQKNNPELYKKRARRKSLKKNYGITPEDYDKMLAHQQGRCAICKRLPTGKRPVLFVDHDHKAESAVTKCVIRGLLCHQCNIGIGNFDDSPEFLRAAAEYLRPTHLAAITDKI